ncbi:hypothetical protein [Arcicella lustrica]|uniref:Uncharacterized protein n=1 Tax=Arcicella lustrica TaxID=2984196 RepID=A0ABU5SL53_9BACT|nr:hypothetical protein [Arcicella sp. DC25W]MEA5428026.1 hypothetical protein [Arcicella sp. DC25W]
MTNLQWRENKNKALMTDLQWCENKNNASMTDFHWHENKNKASMTLQLLFIIGSPRPTIPALAIHQLSKP